MATGVPVIARACGFMPRSLCHLLVLCVLSLSSPSWAQDDSLAIYQKIEQYADKRKVTRWIYDAIFVTPVPDDAPIAQEKPRRRVDPNIKFKNKVIRSIDVRVFDPFGFSVDDTTTAPTNLLQKTGNRLHRRTRDRIIRNLLLVQPFDALDPLKIAESERVLRASPMVNDAALRVVRVAGSKDSVDVIVVVQDKWNIDVSGEGDLGGASATFRDRNFLGWGQELEQRVVYANGGPKLELDGHHSIYNIKRSYISSTLSYSTTADVDRLGLAFDRSFYSSLARWAGGIAADKTWSNDLQTAPASGITSTYHLDPVGFDTWLGHSFTLGDGKTAASQSSNLTLGARYAQTRYAARPPAEVDTLGLYSNSSLFLLSAGLSVRQYYEERYLFRFGATEDVPEGLLCTVTTGVQKRELTATAPYFGVEVSRGRNTDRFGFISLALAYGTFFHQGEVVDGTFRADLTYFSDLQYMGRWHLRQFVRMHSTIGFNKPVYSRISLGGDQLYGLPSDGLDGVHSSVLNLETVAYAPYHLLGFRFAPVLLIGFGNLGEENDPLLSGRIYSAYSLGLLIRNENLLVKTFEISVGYYPVTPDGTTSVFRVNPSISFSLGAKDFAFSRPSVVAF